MFLRERLKALRDGWQELHKMWENRQELLSQSLNLQMFNRDARQAEVLLSQQEHVLSKDETPVSTGKFVMGIYYGSRFLPAMFFVDEFGTSREPY